MAARVILFASGICALSVDYFLPHSQLSHVTKLGMGRKKKNLCRVRFPFISPLGSFLPSSELPLSSGRKGTLEKKAKRTGHAVIYNHGQLGHFASKWNFLKISSFIPEVFFLRFIEE